MVTDCSDDFRKVPGSLDVAYDDISDVWSFIEQDLALHVPLRDVRVRSRQGKEVVLEEIPIRLISSSSQATNSLSAHLNSAVSWFRLPTATLVCISCDDADHYKRNFRLQLRAMVDPDIRHRLAPEIVFVYVRPLTVDPDSKGPARVLDAMRRELGTRNRERVVRIDPLIRPARTIHEDAFAERRELEPNHGNLAAVKGIDELVFCLKMAVSASLENRILAYGNEMISTASIINNSSLTSYIEWKNSIIDRESSESSTRAITGREQKPSECSDSGDKDPSTDKDISLPCAEVTYIVDPDEYLNEVPSKEESKIEAKSPSITEIFLLKDSLAAMLESAGMLEDSLNEYMELYTIIRDNYSIPVKRRLMETDEMRLTTSVDPHKLLSVDQDESTFIWLTWADVRRQARLSCFQGPYISSFIFQQAAFANLMRLMIKLNKFDDLLKFSLELVDDLQTVLRKCSSHQAAQAWAFAVYTSVASTVFKLLGKSENLDESGPNQDKSGFNESTEHLKHTWLDFDVFAEDPDYSRKALAMEKQHSQNRLYEEENRNLIDWKLGPISKTTRLSILSMLGLLKNITFLKGSGTIATDSKKILALLGTLYAKARQALEDLGSVAGFQPPVYSSNLDEAASVMQSNEHQPSTGIFMTPASSNLEASSPRRSSIAGSMSHKALTVDARGSYISGRTSQIESDDDTCTSQPHHLLSHGSMDLGNRARSNVLDESLKEGNEILHSKKMDSVDLSHCDRYVRDMNYSGSEGMIPQKSKPSQEDSSGYILQTPEKNRTNNLVNRSGDSIVNLRTINSFNELREPEYSRERTHVLAESAGTESCSVNFDKRDQESGHFRAKSFGSPEINISGKHSRNASEKLLIDSIKSDALQRSDSYASVERSESSRSALNFGTEESDKANSKSTTLEGIPPRNIIAIEELLEHEIYRKAAFNSHFDQGKTSPRSNQVSPADSKGYFPNHWRLKAAFTSQKAFSDLWCALSMAAATCFEFVGYKRRSLLLSCNVADFCASEGYYEEAIVLYEDQCRVAVREDWLAIAAAYLPKLVDCQARISSPGLCLSAMNILNILISEDYGKFSQTNSNETKIQGIREKMNAAGCSVEASFSLLSKAAQLSSVALQMSQPILPSETGNFADFSAVLRASTTRFSRLSHCLTSRSVIEDAENGKCQTEGHMMLSTGDVREISLILTNNLPVEVPLQNVRLILIAMEGTEVVCVPQAVSSSVSYAHTTGHQTVTFKRQTPGALSWESAHQTSPEGEAYTPFSSMGNEIPWKQPSFFGIDEEEIIVMEQSQKRTEWHDTDQLQCPLTRVKSECNQHNCKIQTDSSEEDEHLLPFDGIICIKPGINELKFLISPIKPAVFRPFRILANFHNLPVQMVVGISQPKSGLSCAGFERRLKFRDHTIVAVAQSPSPHAEVSKLCADGCSLFAGQQQWLGIIISLECKSLREAFLSVSWPPQFRNSGNNSENIRRKNTNTSPEKQNHNMHHRVRSNMSWKSAEMAGLLSTVMIEHPSLIPLNTKIALKDVLEAEKGAFINESSMDSYVTSNIVIEEDGSHRICFLPDSNLQNANVERNVVAGLWWIDIGEQILEPEIIHILPFKAWLRLERQSSAVPATPMGWEMNESCLPGAIVLDKNANSSQALIDVPVCLEFVSGCPRSFLKVLSLPVIQPFVVKTCGIELPGSKILLHCTITSQLPYPVKIQDCIVKPQPGLAFTGKQDQPAIQMLPLIIPARETVSLSFILNFDEPIETQKISTQARIHAAARLCPTAVILDYFIENSTICNQKLYAHPAFRATSPHGEISKHIPEQAIMETTLGKQASIDSANKDIMRQKPKLHLENQISNVDFRRDSGNNLLELSVAPPDLEMLSNMIDGYCEDTEDQVRSEEVDRPTVLDLEKGQSCLFTYQCALEISSLEEDTPETVVLIQLLGPFSMKMNSPTVFCWRLQRAGKSSTASQIQFEVAADNDSWQPLGRQTGTILLGPHDGSLAMVEGLWIPTGIGTIQAPSLRLIDVPFKEIFLMNAMVTTNGMSHVSVHP